jgi:hypothetical protein
MLILPRFNCQGHGMIVIFAAWRQIPVCVKVAEYKTKYMGSESPNIKKKTSFIVSAGNSTMNSFNTEATTGQALANEIDVQQRRYQER